MNKILLIILCVCFVGCGTTDRLTRLKNRGENVTTVEVSADPSTVKKDIQQIASELKLIYQANVETDTYAQVRQNNVSTAFKSLFTGGAFAGYDKLGFFLEYKEDSKKTLVTISEEVMAMDHSTRGSFVDKLKLLDIERQKLAQK